MLRYHRLGIVWVHSQEIVDDVEMEHQRVWRLRLRRARILVWDFGTERSGRSHEEGSTMDEFKQSRLSATSSMP